MYIQCAKNKQKNESLSKNKCFIFYQDLFANEKLFYKLFSVIQTIDKNINHQNGGGTLIIDVIDKSNPTKRERGIKQ